MYCLFIFYLFIDFKEREAEREEEREKAPSICCPTYLCTHWLFLVCALMGDQTHNLGISGLHSNQLSYLPKVKGLYSHHACKNHAIRDICIKSRNMAISLSQCTTSFPGSVVGASPWYQWDNTGRQ